jgi:hypothetical protein
MQSALIGLIGVLIGVLLAEYFRRRNRVEIYSQKVFERRLDIHETLMKLVQGAYAAVSATLEFPGSAKEERHAIVSGAILSIAEFSDENALYIDSYLAADLTAMAIGVEDIPDIEDDIERDAEISAFRNRYKLAKRMILEESGIHQINQHFRLVSRSKPTSPIIQRIKELERGKG